MKQLSLITLLISLLTTFTSCQKDIDPILSRIDSTVSNATGDLLVKNYTKTQVGPDSSVVLYYYNSQKQIVALHFIEGPTDTTDITYRFGRDASGLIVRSVQNGGVSNNDSITMNGGAISKNNILTHVETYPSQPALNTAVTSCYTYNSNNKPVTAIINSITNGVSVTATSDYYYR